VLPWKFGAPLKVAVTGVDPCGSDELVMRAMPLEFTVLVPMITERAAKVTDPAGTPMGVVTVAVKVTD